MPITYKMYVQGCNDDVTAFYIRSVSRKEDDRIFHLSDDWECNIPGNVYREYSM